VRQSSPVTPQTSSRTNQGKPEANPILAQFLSQQSHRAIPSCHEEAGATDARVQVSWKRSRNPRWDRENPSDAQAAREHACNRQPSLAERFTFSLHERGRTYQLLSRPSARRAADSYDIPFCFSVTSPSIQRFDHPPINPNSLLFASRT
jgi:hypothetical protein